MGHNRSPYSRNDDLFLGIKIMQTKWSKSKETNLQSCNFSRPSYLKKHSLDKEIFGGPSSFMSKAPNSSTKYCKVQLYKRFACHAIFLTWLFALVLGSKIPGLEILGIKMINVQVVQRAKTVEKILTILLSLKRWFRRIWELRVDKYGNAQILILFNTISVELGRKFGEEATVLVGVADVLSSAK